MLTIVLLTDLAKSNILKQKYNFLETRANRNRKYYKETHIINQWLKWKEPEDEKFMLALEIGFTDYVIWNIHIRNQIHPGKLFYCTCKSGLIQLFDIIIGQEEKIENMNLQICYDGFIGACVGGNLDIIKIFIAKFTDIEHNHMWDSGLYYACQNGHKEIINLMIANGAADWNNALYGACQSQHIKLVNLMIANGANDWNRGLYYACKTGNKEIIELMLVKGANNWNEGLKTACYYGHKEIAELMIVKGANNWNDGLTNACSCGNLEIAELMIVKGANNWNEGLINACICGNLELVKLMIIKGADDWNNGLLNTLEIAIFDEDLAEANNKSEILELMIAKGANCWNEALRVACLNRHTTNLIKILLATNKPTNIKECLEIAIALDCDFFAGTEKLQILLAHNSTSAK